MAPTPITTTTDMLLVRCRKHAADGLAAAAAAFCTSAPVPLALHRVAWSPESGLAYVYARPHATQDAVDTDALAALWARTCPAASATQACRLSLLFDAPGASAGEPARFHYVVETDAEAGWMDEIGRWYDTEHMPGLAAVPGCIHARRFASPDAGPYSFACYDLTAQETLGSPPWLAVRHTAWSDRARPHFTNTRRTMMHVLA
jgi:hypothetical protein